MALLAGCGSSSHTGSPASSPAGPVATSTTASAPSTAAAPAAPQQSPLLAGNAHPSFPPGQPGQVTVVYQAPIVPKETGTAVPIVIRNNTSKGVAHVDISASASDPTGKIVASGSSQGTDPSVIQPGQWSLAFIYFGPGTAVAAGDKMTFSVKTSAADTSSYNTAAIQVTQANLSGTSIAGGVQNTTGHDVQGPISVNVFCFDASGNPTYTQGGFTSGSGDLAAGATDSFQVDFYNQHCPSYLVGASGYYK